MFVNAKEMHKNHPDEFSIPSQAMLDSIKKADNVKVCAGKERFWVYVTEREGNNIKGVVNNNLINTSVHGLKLGSKVEVTTDNVYYVIKG
jgi:uncharacterized protein YegJ (DUF2314 family)